MGNLKKWAGPLSDSWHKSRMKLQQKILSRMVSLGMTPVLSAFAGHVPDEMKKCTLRFKDSNASFLKIFTVRLYPNASITPLSRWTSFNCTYSCIHFVEPTDPLFGKIGSEFMTEVPHNISFVHTKPSSKLSLF